jgi:hypothetical protein
MKKISRALILFIALTHSASPMNALFFDELYALKAQEYLNIVTKNGKLVLPVQGLKQYLYKRIQNAQLCLKSKATLEEMRNECYYFLNSNTLRMQSIALASDVAHRQSYYFAVMVAFMESYHMSMQLHCYDSSLHPDPSVFPADFEKVSPDQFVSRVKKSIAIACDIVTHQCLMCQHFAVESKKCAEAILHLIET